MADCATLAYRGAGLVGHARSAAAERPLRVELQIDDAWLEDGLLLFQVNRGLFVVEFRLVSEDDAIVGAAVHKLPFQVSASKHRQSIEGHRVRLARQ